MIRHTVNIEIERPVADVFAYLDDVSAEREWQPALRIAQQEPPGETRVGTRKRYVSTFVGREVENTYVVVELEPGRRVVCETTPDSSVEARSEVVCEAWGEGGTRVTFRIEGTPKGMLRWMPGKVLEVAYREQLESSLQRLKAVLENHGGDC